MKNLAKKCSPPRESGHKMSRVVISIVLCGFLTGLIAKPAAAQWCNLVFIFDDLDTAGTTTSETSPPPTVVLELRAVTINDIVGPATCTNPNFEPWEPSRFLIVSADATVDTARSSLRRCASLATIVQTDPDRFQLKVTLGTSTGSTGLNSRLGNGTAWGYSVAYDSVTYIGCALLKSN